MNGRHDGQPARDRFAAIIGRALAASPPPWVVERLDEYDHLNGEVETWTLTTGDPSCDEADTAFMAHSRDDIPWLLAEVARRDDALRAVMATLTDTANNLSEGPFGSLGRYAARTWQFRCDAADMIAAISAHVDIDELNGEPLPTLPSTAGDDGGGSRGAS